MFVKFGCQRWQTVVLVERPVSEVANFAVLCQHGRPSVSRWLGLLNESRSSTQSVSNRLCICTYTYRLCGVYVFPAYNYQ